MNEHPKIRRRIRLKRKHKSTYGFNFLRQKRASPSLSLKKKSKEKKWEQQFKKLEENIDLNTVKNNFQHFFHINLEEGKFDKDLVELEKAFTPCTFWRLINFSYFQDSCLKEKIDNLKKELSINNYNEDILLIQDDCELNENKTGYKYNSLLTDLHDCKIKSDFFKQVKSLIEYIKKNNNIISIDLFNDNEEEPNSFEKDKNLINYFIKKIHELNEKNLKSLKLKTDKYISSKFSYNTNYKNDTFVKKLNYIKCNPILELNNESITKFNKLIDYINNKEVKESHNFELDKKIFSFSEKFIDNNNTNKCLTLSNNISSDRISQTNLSTQNICCICNNGDVEQNQLLFRCEQCGLVVHQNCYGAKDQDMKNWVCDPCKEMPKEDVYNLECFLCPVHGGAFKKIELPIESTFYNNIMDYKHNKKELPNNNYNIIIPKKDYDKTSFAWAHLSCALWNSNINLKNYERKTGISLKNISYEDFHSYCSLCKKDNCGPTIKCNNDSCDLSFHPECARINNCCLEVEIINKEYQYNVYCYKHRPNLLAKKINLNCQNEIQQIILANQELNNIYELYKKVYKNDLYQREKILNQIEIFTENSQSLKKHRNHKNKVNISLNKRYKNSKNLENIVIKLSKRGRKRKDIINNYFNNSANNLKYLSKKKTIRKIINKSKKLKTIKIENFNSEYPNLINASTIINNIGNGNNINIYVNNYNHVLNCGIASTKRKSEIKKNNKNNLQSSFLSPTIEINKKEFDKFDNSKKTKFEVEKYIEDKNEFIIFLIGFLNDYTLNNRIIIKKNSKNIHLIDNTKCPLQYLKYDDFLNNDIPWDEIGYKNLSSSILRKSFFAIIPDEKKFKK